MSRVRGGLTLVLILVVAATVWILSRRTAPPEVEFIKVTRETIVSSLGTNGKVEPIEWLPARAERAGTIARVLITRGQQVRKDQPMVELDTRIASAQLGKAEAAIHEAQTEERVLDQGGKISERQQVDADLARARLDLDAAQKQQAALERLVAKQAATQVELDAQKQTVAQLRLRIQSLEERKSALVTGSDREIAKAKLRGAEASAAVARVDLDLSVIRAPMDGIVYDFDLKAGAYLNPGDLVAKVGKLDRVRVTVYVDEPDVGKVRLGEAVIITWDALAGHRWKGQVDKLPTQVTPLGTRQVGEVGCVIENPDRDLLPNANINAEIQAAVIEGALVLPKEAFRREGPDTGVFLLSGDRVEWRKVKLGVSSYTKSQVVSGLAEGDAVALPTEKTIKNGSRVEAVIR